MNTKLQTLKGFRDFLPKDVQKREFVLEKIKKVFRLFGFEEIQTPTLEYASVILGKYGEEADKLVYTFVDKGGRKIALPYDLTVPTARVLAQYQNLPKYFRRFQIQNVFRAEKPQKGRFREFTQCDIDIFGSISEIADAEIIACTYFVFKAIGFANIILRINDRKILFETLEKYANKNTDTFSIIQTIDKLGKRTQEEVVDELVSKGLAKQSAEKALEEIKSAKITPTLQKIIDFSQGLGVCKSSIKFEPTLARGLDYYTGMIFEVDVPGYPMGSFAGGGRYDNLIKKLGGNETPAVGVAFGLDRIIEAAEKLNLTPKKAIVTKVLVSVFDEQTLYKTLEVTQKLRESQIATELYPVYDRLDKQLKYADKKGISWVIIIGPEEAEKNMVQLKNMKTGEQEELGVDDMVKKLQD